MPQHGATETGRRPAKTTAGRQSASEEPFENGYFEWQKRAEEKGYKVVTIVTREDSDLPLAAGAVKVMAETLKAISKPLAWPGRDFNYVFPPMESDDERGSDEEGGGEGCQLEVPRDEGGHWTW